MAKDYKGIKEYIVEILKLFAEIIKESQKVNVSRESLIRLLFEIEHVFITNIYQVLIGIAKCSLDDLDHL